MPNSLADSVPRAAIGTTFGLSFGSAALISLETIVYSVPATIRILFTLTVVTRFEMFLLIRAQCEIHLGSVRMGGKIYHSGATNQVFPSSPRRDVAIPNSDGRM